ncbi:MAG: Unknown protein [uncultured Sulfurovum sp.]|uniref:Uncharacterized protein n=1 Tax=uncultured Sulfurovum sp. TaxID=269237 RepID=A0A6S6RYB2_9BACT|nr:MAG: Unknown protein [uncultured Sulfurovum sp.]
MRLFLSIIFVISSFTSCSKPTGGLNIAFEALGSEVNSKYGSEGLHYRSSINITGLGQNQVIGEILTVPGQKIPDTHAIPIITDCSKVAVSLYDTNASIYDIRAIQNALNELIQLQSIAIAIETEIVFIRLLKQRMEDKPKNKELQFEIAKRYGKSDNILPTKLTFLQNELQKNQKLVLSKRSTLNTIQPGIIIAHWTSSKQKNMGGFFGSLFATSINNQVQREGFVILAGLKTESIWLGDDFASYVTKERTGSDAIINDKGYIVTYKLSAKHRAYSETFNYQQLISTRLSLSPEDIQKILGTHYAELFTHKQAELRLSFSNMIGATNKGVLTAAKKHLFEYRFYGDKAYADSVIYNYNRTTGYSEVYSVRSNIAELKQNFKQLKVQTSSCENNRIKNKKLNIREPNKLFKKNILLDYPVQ